MKRILPLLLLGALTGCATMPRESQELTLEFRPGSASPGAGLTEMTVAGSDQVVFLANEVLLSNDDVASSRVVSGPYGPQIDLVFTPSGAEKFATATENNLMKPIGILIDGQLISAPIVRARIAGGKAVIAGHFSEEEARRIANGIVPRQAGANQAIGR